MSTPIQRRRESCWPTPTQENLLRAALLQGDAARSAWAAWKTEANIDQLDAGSQGLLPLAYHNLHKQGVTDEVVDWCKGFYRRTWYMNQLTQGKLETLIADLRAAGIERVMLLKGAGLVRTVYGDPGLRMMTDADVLVPTDQADIALDLLTRQGFEPSNAEDHPHARDFRHASGFNVDLHWHALYDCSWPDADADFWSGAIEQSVGKQPAWVLNPTDQLLHVLSHGMAWQLHQPPIRWVADAMTILNQRGADIDWARIVDLTRKLKLSLRMRGALDYLQTRWDVAVPRAAYREIRRIPTTIADLYHYEARQHFGDVAWRPVWQLWRDYRSFGNGTLRHQVVEFTRYLKLYYAPRSPWLVPLLLARDTVRARRRAV